MHTDLAAQTLERATSALKAGAVTWLPEIVKLMRSLSGNSAEVSVTELAELIQKDATILAKVIGAANTMGFNPSGVPVTGVTQAVHVIGYERIRTLAMSLMLAENSVRTSSPDEQREAIALALTSACVAQTMARSRMLLDPGQAFVCASLRNFGRIVMTACMADEYRAASGRAGDEQDDEVFRETFGLTPLDLGRELLKSADLPPEILACLRELPPEAFTVLETTPDARMLALTDFAGKLAQLALAPAASSEIFVQKYRALAERYDQLLPGVAGEVQALLQAAELQLTDLVRDLRLSGVSLKSLNRLRRRCAAVEAENEAAAEPAPAPGAAPPAVAAPPAAALVAKPVVAPAVSGAKPVAAAPAPAFDWHAEEENFANFLKKPGLTRDEILDFLVDRLHVGLKAPECLLFSAPTGQPVHRLTHGCGMLFQTLEPHAQIRANERTVFGICLTRQENVLIQRADDPGIRAYFPPWLCETNRLGAFVLLPLVTARQSYGVVLVGWRSSQQLLLGTDQARLIRHLLALACQAYELIRTPAAV